MALRHNQSNRAQSRMKKRNESNEKGQTGQGSSVGHLPKDFVVDINDLRQWPECFSVHPFSTAERISDWTPRVMANVNIVKFTTF